MNDPVNSRAFTVALTGGIASGKSAIAKRFAALAVPVFDADVAARAVVEPGQPALHEIVAAFGRSVLAADGTLDRARMRDIVFADSDARQRLEKILHPRIRSLLRAQVADCDAEYCILAVPLLIEVWNHYGWVQRVLTTDVPPGAQLRRLTGRSGIDAGLAQHMIQAQATRAERLAIAHDVIDNTGPLEALDSIVARLHRRYLALARNYRGAKS